MGEVVVVGEVETREPSLRLRGCLRGWAWLSCCA